MNGGQEKWRSEELSRERDYRYREERIHTINGRDQHYKWKGNKTVEDP